MNASPQRLFSLGRRLLLVGAVPAAALAVAAGVGSAAAPSGPPENFNTPPSISGAAREGSTLTAAHGFWTNNPTSYRYRWLRCDANGNACALIGAEGRQYRSTGSDVGHRIRVRVTATNSAGSGTADSPNATEIVVATGATPANAAKPSISGDPREGSTLTVSNGTWTGTQPISFTYQWTRCDQAGAACAAVAGATGTSYNPTSADVSHTLRVRLTAKNSRGTSAVDTDPTALVAPARSGGAAVSVTQVSLPNRLIVDNVRFTPNPITSRNAVTARFHVSDSRGFAIQGALVYALGLPYGWVRNSTEVATDASGWATVTMQPTSAMPLKRGALVVFVRARKPGENLLAGVSTRRLVQASIR
jgi:hypothetical protein